MFKKRNKFVLAIVVATITLLFGIEISQAARWRYHSWRPGWITVWGTRNCRRVTRPLMYRRWMWRCRTVGGYLPWCCNDFLVRHEWGWPCWNVTWRKYVAHPCPLSCWRRRWVMGSLSEYFEDYIPYYYEINEVVIPTIGDPDGHITGNQDLYVFTDIGDWLDGTVGDGRTYEPLPSGADPNERYFDFSEGRCHDLPGFIVMRVDPPNTPVEELMVFNPDADPNGYPFEVTQPELLFTGRLYLQSEETFSPEEYNGYLMQGDINVDGVLDLDDFLLFSDVWTQDVNSVGPIDEVPIELFE